MKYKSNKQLSDEQKAKVSEKLNRVIMVNLVEDLCQRKNFPVERFNLWFKDNKNEQATIILFNNYFRQALAFKSDIELTVTELKNL